MSGGVEKIEKIDRLEGVSRYDTYQNRTRLSELSEKSRSKPLDWHGRAIQKITQFEQDYIDKKIPHLWDYLGEDIRIKLTGVKTKSDIIFREIEKAFAPIANLEKFERFLDENEFAECFKPKSTQQEPIRRSVLKDDEADALERNEVDGLKYEELLEESEESVASLDSSQLGQQEIHQVSRRKLWKKALYAFGLFLVKLPLRAARNILALLVDIVKAAVYTVAHPVKATLKLAKMILNLLKALTKPETWSEMGAGMIGVSLGQLALGNPLVPIGFIIGAAMLFAGLSAGALVAAIEHYGEDECLGEVGKQIFEQLRKLPEAMLTGFLFGLMFGAIQKAQHKEHLEEVNKSSYGEVESNPSLFSSGAFNALDIPASGTTLARTCVNVADSYNPLTKRGAQLEEAIAEASKSIPPIHDL